MKSLKYPILLLCVLIMTGAALVLTASGQTIEIKGTRIAINGKPTFLSGFYHGSWAGTDARLMGDLEQIAAAGYNLLHPAIGTDDEAFIRRAEQLGVQLIIEANDYSGKLYALQAWGNRPGILGWTIADDCNGNPGVPTTTINANRALIDQYAVRHLTYINCGALGGASNLSPYMGLSEFIGLQTYAIPSDPVLAVDQQLIMADGVRGTRNIPLIANIQSFAFSGQRAPTPDEIRNMTYQAFMNDVDGILYYTFLDFSWDIENTTRAPGIWAEMQRLGQETKAFSPIIIDGQLTRLPAPSPMVRVARWNYLGKQYYVIINGDARSVSNVVIPVGSGIQSAVPMFANRPAGFSLQGTNLVGTMAAHTVHVYVLTPTTGVVTATPTATRTPSPTPNGPTPTQDWGFQVTGFTLVNTSTGRPIRTLLNNDVIDIATVGTNFTIRAETFPQTIGSVQFQVNGVNSTLDREFPYTMGGDSGGTNASYYSWSYGSLGARTLRAIPYSWSNQAGTEGRTLTINFTITNSRTATATRTPTRIPPTATRIPPTATRIPPTATRIPPTATRIPPTATRTGTTQSQPAVSSLTLINAQNGAAVLTITNGMTINLPALGLTQ
ncbi:MAG: hypothetical protein MUE40_19955, partial [Anaerolineae bacterium]|nr:hypothetical protein [Anaerolineae bacterium]